MIDNLNEIRNHVIDKFFKKQWKDVWFYPEHPKIKGVKGYLGTQDIIFVGLNPSRGKFPSKADDFFYEELKKNGFKNAHLTDLIKLRATEKEVNSLLKNKEFICEQIEILKKEIEAIKPTLIVPMHDKVRKILNKELKDYEIKYIPHYSHCNRWGKRDKFRNAIRGIKDRYVSLKEKKTDN